jgi:Spy/CpxP family protein refolding chaperone
MRFNTVSASLLSCCFLLMSAKAIAADPLKTGAKQDIVAQLPPPPFDGGPDCPDFMMFRGLEGGHGFPPGPPPGAFLSGGPMAISIRHSAPLMMPLPPDVELTDTQIEQLAQLKRETEAKATPIQAKISSLEHSRSIALNEENINQGEISKQSGEINEQRQLLDGILTHARIQMAQALTAEQRHKMKLFAERRELGPMGFKKPPSAKTTEHP